MAVGTLLGCIEGIVAVGTNVGDSVGEKLESGEKLGWVAVGTVVGCTEGNVAVGIIVGVAEGTNDGCLLGCNLAVKTIIGTKKKRWRENMLYRKIGLG